MEEEGTLKHWTLPAQGLSANAPCSNHPPGNSPEMMPLDDNLFKDWTDGLCTHQLCTINLPEDDPRKFSKSTPNRLSSSMRRAWEGCPSSARIIQDVKRVACHNMPCIRDKGGIACPDLGNSRGRRSTNQDVKSSNWGGRREKKPVMLHDNQCLHPDAINARNQLISKAVEVKKEQRAKLEETKNAMILMKGGKN